MGSVGEIIIGLMLIVIGIPLCLTLIGVLIGAPLIFAGYSMIVSPPEKSTEENNE